MRDGPDATGGGAEHRLVSVGFPEGVRPLDHTADVGIEVTAPELESLFHAAARGMAALLTGDEDAAAPDGPGSGRTAPGAPRPRRLELDADDAASLLALWLRELLWLYQDGGALYRDARFETLTETRLAARVRFEADPPRAHREIKGVTYHGLAARREGEGWYARVIFDV